MSLHLLYVWIRRNISTLLLARLWRVDVQDVIAESVRRLRRRVMMMQEMMMKSRLELRSFSGISEY